jgi:phosphatidylinositol kinase/protein kinase (PI-3  family)
MEKFFTESAKPPAPAGQQETYTSSSLRQRYKCLVNLSQVREIKRKPWHQRQENRNKINLSVGLD